MYLPKHFEQTDEDALSALMQQHPLATLVSVQGGEPTADHVPLRWDAGSRTLTGHVARANPLWRVAAGQPVLAVFRGAEAYVSPNWYPGKAEHHKVVPTWNYAVVHAHGLLEAVEDAPWLHGLVSGLTDHHEAHTARHAPDKAWAVSDAPDDYVQQMLRAIVGIRIPVTRLVGKWKVSQNRSEADRAGVARGLREQADPTTGQVAAPMAAQMAALVEPPPA